MKVSILMAEDLPIHAEWIEEILFNIKTFIICLNHIGLVRLYPIGICAFKRGVTVQKLKVLFLSIFTGKSDALRYFMQSEYSDENFDFWFAVEEFKRATKKDKINKAFEIMNEFVDDRAERQVSTL